LDRGRLDKALADAEKAMSQGPADARAFFVRGRVRLERGVDGALADLKKAVDMNRRKDGVMLHWLASALFRAGQKDESVKVQREALKLRPNDIELQEQLKEIESGTGVSPKPW
jgi:tetratricopeptide (TPR) repeat protein